MVFQTEKALDEVGDKLSDSDKSQVQADLQALKDVLAKADVENLSDSDIEEIKAGREKLMNSAQNLFSKLYEQNGPGANAGTGTASPDYSSDDGDVVDGDYTEV